MYASAQTRQLETLEPADAATRESLAPNFTFIAHVGLPPKYSHIC